MFYTYAHYTPEGLLFYIGKGQKRRAYSFYKRNRDWKNIVSKYGQPTVKIISEWITEQEALHHEIALIKQYRTQGFKLCNLTDGGEGTSEYKATAEQIEVNRVVHLGQSPWNKGVKVGAIHSEEFKAKISALHKGNKWRLGRPTSAKQKAIASQLSKGNAYAAGNTNNRIWVWMGTSLISGEVVKYTGKKEMIAAGLQHSNIIKCINGERKSHKGYTWDREPWRNCCLIGD